MVLVQIFFSLLLLFDASISLQFLLVLKEFLIRFESHWRVARKLLRTFHHTISAYLTAVSLQEKLVRHRGSLGRFRINRIAALVQLFAFLRHDQLGLSFSGCHRSLGREIRPRAIGIDHYYTILLID